MPNPYGYSELENMHIAWCKAAKNRGEIEVYFEIDAVKWNPIARLLFHVTLSSRKKTLANRFSGKMMG
jgi:hypothetical protein